MADVEDVSSPKLVLSQKGKRMLHYREHLFYLNKTRKYGETITLLLQCQRRRDTQCSVYVTTDESCAILKDSTVSRILKDAKYFEILENESLTNSCCVPSQLYSKVK